MKHLRKFNEEVNLPERTPKKAQKIPVETEVVTPWATSNRLCSGSDYDWSTWVMGTKIHKFVEECNDFVSQLHEDWTDDYDDVIESIDYLCNKHSITDDDMAKIVKLRSVKKLEILQRFCEDTDLSMPYEGPGPR